jgi:hypothetical protein
MDCENSLECSGDLWMQLPCRLTLMMNLRLILCIVFCILLVSCSFGKQRAESSRNISGSIPNNAMIQDSMNNDQLRIRNEKQVLKPNDVLKWRLKYESLLGKSKGALIELYGSPKTVEEKSSYKRRVEVLLYEPHPKTNDRKINLFMESGKIIAVTVFPKNNEVFYIEDIINPEYKLNWGRDITTDIDPAYNITSEQRITTDTNYYSTTTTLDGRNSIHFKATASSMDFYAITFSP